MFMLSERDDFDAALRLPFAIASRVNHGLIPKCDWGYRFPFPAFSKSQTHRVMARQKPVWVEADL